MLLLLGNICSFINTRSLPRKKMDTVKSGPLGTTAKGFTSFHNVMLLFVLLLLPRLHHPTTLMCQLFVLRGPAQIPPPSWYLCDFRCFAYHIWQDDTYFRNTYSLPWLSLQPPHLVVSDCLSSLWFFPTSLKARLQASSSTWPLEYTWCA